MEEDRHEVTRVVDEDGSTYWFDGHLTRGDVNEQIGPQATFAHYIAEPKDA